jgi:hypothetical protein
MDNGQGDEAPLHKVLRTNKEANAFFEAVTPTSDQPDAISRNILTDDMARELYS